MLVQSAFFAAYLIISIPGALLVKKVGYMRGAVIGLLTMMVGCLLFIPASASATFGVFLIALFVLASGIPIGILTGGTGSGGLHNPRRRLRRPSVMALLPLLLASASPSLRTHGTQHSSVKQSSKPCRLVIPTRAATKSARPA